MVVTKHDVTAVTRGSLEALPSAEEAPVVEHVLGGGVEGPVAALAGVARLPGDLEEAVVEGEVVADAVLPRREALSVVRESEQKVMCLTVCMRNPFADE